MDALALARAAMAKGSESFWAAFFSFWQKDVPDLLKLLAKSLSKAKLPKSVGDVERFTMADWLAAAPILAGIMLCIATPLALLLGERSGAAPAKGDLRRSYVLTREALLRGMGLCYGCGFLVSAIQHRALWGSLGLLPHGWNPHGRPAPAFEFMDRMGWGYGDWQLELVSWLGVALAVQLMFGRVRTFLVPLALWALYLSIVNLSAPFTFSYGWEWLTCEVGFLMIFLCPLGAAGFASWTPPPRLVLWLIRWCAFRLLLGAGMSKVGRNSSACWRELTCTTTHYFTQPVPNPAAWFMHHLPLDVHKLEVALTFVEQLVLPFFMLLPVRAFRLLAALLEIGFQLAVVGTGNYAWINFIGALPCLSMIDDAAFAWICPASTVQRAREAVVGANVDDAPFFRRVPIRSYRALRGCVSVLLVMVMAYKSKDPIRELFGPAPWINTYDEWFLMNSQGVFGFINQHRVQIVLQYTHAAQPASPWAEWSSLDFKCIPGNVTRRPCFMSPYHYRLDWETWIRVTASGEHLWTQRAPADVYHSQLVPEFLQALIVRLLSGDDDAAGLMGTPRGQLYRDGKSPTAISVDFASYTFVDRDDRSGAWWRAEPVAPNSRRVYGAAGHQLPPAQIRRSPPQRHWILGISTVTFVAAVEFALASLLSLDMPATLWALVLAAHQAHLFGLALASDYASAWPQVERFMPLCSQIPGCEFGETVDWRVCGYTYVQHSSFVGAGLLFVWHLARRKQRANVAAWLPFLPYPAIYYMAMSAKTGSAW